MKFVDLYAGIGGFRYALESFGYKCVFSSEKNNQSIETYIKNFGDDPTFDMDHLENMTDEEIDSLIPNHDILTGGFPCQSFSIGGKKEGFETKDTKGTQFFNIMRILEVKKPKYIILENVKHLTKHDNGKTFKVITEELIRLGYNLNNIPLVISPVDLGIPQNRERIFIVGSLEKKIEISIPKNNSILELKKDVVKKTNLTNFELEVIKGWEKFVKGVKRTKTGNIPVIWIDEMISTNIDPKWQEWKIKYVSKMREFYSENKKFIDGWLKETKAIEWNNKKYRKLEWSAGNESSNFKDKHMVIRQSGLRIRKGNIFPTQVAVVETPIIFDLNINSFRKLTPNEVARLQSFPREFIPHFKEYHAYKQLGNAVNVDVVKYVAKEMMK